MTATMKVPVVIHSVAPSARTSRFVSAPVAVTKTKHLASRLQQNWMARHPNDTCSNGWVSLDDSLTSLSWLQNLNILKIATPTSSSSPSAAVQHDHKSSKSRTPSPVMHIQVGMANMVPINPKFDSRLPLADTPPLYSTSTSGLEGLDYRTNPYIKPPFSYATLICMAMKETKKQKITLSSIYNWITENFMYYRMADPSWQNSIRHNLSLNKCFEKVPRRKDEPGKGGFWRINPEYSDMIENGIFKKRRGSRDSCLLPPSKRVRRDDDELLVAVNSIKGVREDKLLSNGSTLNFIAHGDDEEDSFMLQGDFNWTAILNQDIDIGGARVKTEHIIDGDDSGPLVAMSPPLSETNSDDLGLEDLFSQTDISMKVHLDCTTHYPLDLTITGKGIQPPQWWGDNLLGGIKMEPQDLTEHCSGLHTPIAPSPSGDRDDLWGNPSDLDGSSAFDLDNLFDIGNIPSPQML